MKWFPFMLSFFLEKMCELIKSGMRTNKGFKEVHMTAMAHVLVEHYGDDISSTQVYNHLRKWRIRRLTSSRFRDLSGAQWCKESS
ncbi:hypothetical protein QYE76_025547 [Lolium multiflorum]|uniref:Myb/SANT-like domain-containing protein n=1 Tax=Lolium multiflorum TaxID=4521 RepID=A0AAD8VWS9_LOLMU|nr:hypothetical protein QYE76_025547 [Lolium multiflorum]